MKKNRNVNMICIFENYEQNAPNMYNFIKKNGGLLADNKVPFYEEMTDESIDLLILSQKLNLFAFRAIDCLSCGFFGLQKVVNNAYWFKGFYEQIQKLQVNRIAVDMPANSDVIIEMLALDDKVKKLETQGQKISEKESKRYMDLIAIRDDYMANKIITDLSKNENQQNAVAMFGWLHAGIIYKLKEYANDKDITLNIKPITFQKIPDFNEVFSIPVYDAKKFHVEDVFTEISSLSDKKLN